MASKLTFPLQKALCEELKTTLLQDDPTRSYYAEKGIIRDIAQLAAARIGGATVRPIGVQMCAALIIADLRRGSDGTTGKKIDSLYASVIKPMFDQCMIEDVKDALLSLGQKVEKVAVSVLNKPM